MPIFRAKGRSWEAYVAAIGVSGMLMASGVVIFVILVGVVTFKTWPQAGGLLGGGPGDVSLQEAATPAPGRGVAQPSNLNLVKLPSGGAAASSNRGGGSGGIGTGPTIGGSGGSPSGSVGQPGGSGGGQPQGAQPPPSSTQSPNLVAKAVSDAGNTVQANTDSLGNTLGGNSSPGVGGLVGGAGRALNNDLQSLTGNH
jgi:hypothetical protein